ncbi:MAG: hypothetical protein AMXMBFR84_30400 [Candidatus Hydrogenedentota bacterium]
MTGNVLPLLGEWGLDVWLVPQGVALGYPVLAFQAGKPLATEAQGGWTLRNVPIVALDRIPR